MQAIRQELTVKEGNFIEIHSPILRAGVQVEVIVLLKDEKLLKEKKFCSLMGKGKGSFNSPNDVDAFIRGERDKWE